MLRGPPQWSSVIQEMIYESEQHIILAWKHKLQECKLKKLQVLFMKTQSIDSTLW